jgi:hypothetical protein
MGSAHSLLHKCIRSDLMAASRGRAGAAIHCGKNIRGLDLCCLVGFPLVCFVSSFTKHGSTAERRRGSKKTVRFETESE